jgi:hypothetical protein
MPVSDIQVFTDDPVIDECAKFFAWAISEAITLSQGQGDFAHFMRARYSDTVSAIERVDVETLDDRAFSLKEGVLTINRIPLSALARYIRADFVACREGARHVPDPAMIDAVIKRTALLFLFHELSHVRQGVGRYESVAKLKQLAGANVMADLDLIADRDAAIVVSGLLAGGKLDRREQLQAFKSMLFLMGQYCFPVFGFSRENLPKMARAVGLVLMAARLSAADWVEGWSKDDESLALDSCLMCYPGADLSSLSLHILEPSPRILTVEADLPDQDLAQLVASIETGAFEHAISCGCSILRSIGMGPR